MIKIIRKRGKRLLADAEGNHKYKELERMIKNGDDLTEWNAMKIYGECNLRGTVTYLNKYKGYNIIRVKVRNRTGNNKSYLARWWEQVNRTA